MHADETLAIVMHERYERRLLLVVHFEVAAGIEKYGVKIIQVFRVVLQLFLGKRFRIGANRGVP